MISSISKSPAISSEQSSAPKSAVQPQTHPQQSTLARDIATLNSAPKAEPGRSK